MKLPVASHMQNLGFLVEEIDWFQHDYEPHTKNHTQQLVLTLPPTDQTNQEAPFLPSF